MEYVCDFHLHSKYSRAVSQNMILGEMERFALKKGIDVLTASDFTHPLWFRELKAQLVEDGEGVYKLKNSDSKVRFVLSTEISSIYSQGGKTRRVHNLVFAPSLETVEKINAELIKRGANLSADGRPIIGLSSRNLLDLVLTVDPNTFLIPCHAWTPWFSLYGSNSGFDSIEECFQDLSKEIYGIETGLSSDPEMNWRIKELENRSILSFSDAHSAIKMGREATVFDLTSLSFTNIKNAIKKNGAEKISYTIEFYPEEGKYHYTGHRNCKISQTPEQTRQNGVICPVCKRPLTVGVMERVEKLATSPTNLKTSVDELGVTWVEDPSELHPKYVKLVPLVEIIAESVGVMPGSLKILAKFDEVVQTFGSEINVLIKTPISDIEKQFGERIAQGIGKVRKQDIYVDPGFDGEFGKVKIWDENAKDQVQAQEKKEESQLGLF
ncbi:MAG TPA: endonuclease Q family protein [Patescibacteria group bacterium]|nr:endonuclease Q family protein [Patescibacteria group bacterium]